jgi:SAM-dependent methyltransferase
MLKNLFQNIYEKAVDLNHKNISKLFDKKENILLLDLGCDDGILIKKIADEVGIKNIYGVDIMDERIEIANKNGLLVKKFDLNTKFDFGDNFFDIVHANQVIEHLYDSDNFISEIYRVLKPGGCAIISTENASSWCNIFASIMGWQIFSLTNFSNIKDGIGNPLALHKGKSNLESWCHSRIYNIRGLKEYFEIFEFKVEEIRGSGYFPFPAIFGNLDKIHCHFMTFKIRK